MACSLVFNSYVKNSFSFKTFITIDLVISAMAIGLIASYLSKSPIIAFSITGLAVNSTAILHLFCFYKRMQAQNNHSFHPKEKNLETTKERTISENRKKTTKDLDKLNRSQLFDGKKRGSVFTTKSTEKGEQLLIDKQLQETEMLRNIILNNESLREHLKELNLRIERTQSNIQKMEELIKRKQKEILLRGGKNYNSLLELEISKLCLDDKKSLEFNSNENSLPSLIANELSTMEAMMHVLEETLRQEKVLIEKLEILCSHFEKIK